MDNRQQTDQEWARLALSSSEAFGIMADRYYNRVYFTALALVKQPEMAEDITQETFLRVWLKRDWSTDAHLMLQPWLIRIARNLAIDWLRRGQQRSRVLPLISIEELPMEPVDHTNPGPRQAVAETEQASQLNQAVMALPDDLRQTVLLHYGEGLTPSDIARLNGEAPSTVTRRLERARQQLRAHLENSLTASLASLKPPRQTVHRLTAMVAAVSAVPVATRAEVARLVADTPPPPLIDPAQIAANTAASLKEAGIMKTLFAGATATKWLIGTAAALAITAGAYGIVQLTGDVPDRETSDAGGRTQTRITASDSGIGDFTAEKITHRVDPSGHRTLNRNGNPNATASLSKETALAPSAPATTSTEAIQDFVIVRGLVSDALTSEPLANAVVRGLAPGQDMRGIRDKNPVDNLITVRTNDSGHYEIRIPLSQENRTIALDAFSPGYRSLAGTFMSGGDFPRQNIAVTPGQTLTENLDLFKAAYISGRVVDDKGNPVSGIQAKGTIEYVNEKGMAFIANAITNESGHFEIFDFRETGQVTGLSNAKPPQPFTMSYKGVLTLSHKDWVTTSIPDIYQLSEVQRANLLITVESGNTMTGQLLDTSGSPVPDLNLHIQYRSDQKGERRDVITGKDGFFTLKGLPDGQATLYAHSLALDQKLETTVTLPVSGDLTLRMTGTPYADTSNAVTLLGMKLIDITPELQTKYGLYSTSGVLVLNPGSEIQRLNFSTKDNPLSEGSTFFHVGNKRISNLKEFVSEVLAVNRLPKHDQFVHEGYEGYIRVAYNGHKSKFSGSITNYMVLTSQDIQELENYLRSLEQ